VVLWINPKASSFYIQGYYLLWPAFPGLFY
jgi:hypothetical protein